MCQLQYAHCQLVVQEELQLDSPAVDLHQEVVDLPVGQVASVVLQGVFDGDDGEDHQQGNHGDLLLKGLHHRHPVQQRQEQEVEVGCPAKMEKIDYKEEEEVEEEEQDEDVYLRNCWKRLTGMKVSQLYLVVQMALPL